MKKAFTMAEVLITLGILGVVIAMTLPSLISQHRKKEVEAKLKKFYSIANQAIMLSEVKNGPKEYWAGCDSGLDTASTLASCEEWYNIYLKDFLKTLKVEHFTSGKLQNTAAWLADGSLLVIKNGYDMYFYPFAKDFDKDTFYSQADDGSYSRPDCGTKYFAFSFQPNNATMCTSTSYKGKGIEPYRSLICDKDCNCNTITHDELLNHTTYGCNKNSQYKVYCTALIQDNNWEIPDDYPFKF